MANIMIDLLIWILIFHLVMCAVNLLALSWPKPWLQPKSWPKVSVLVPARNEILNVQRLVESFAAQDYSKYELIVLDDQSDDGTYAALKKLSREHKCLKVIKGKKLPQGWVGKPWACHQLQAAAKAPYLLFIDADEWAEPGFIKKVMGIALATGSDLLTGLMQVRVSSFWPALGLPFFVTAGMTGLPFFMLGFKWFKRGAAIGGCLLFTRKSYDALGGHQALGSAVVEDMAFGDKVKRGGGRLIFVNLQDYLSTIMYRDFAGIWEGFSKNLSRISRGPVLTILFAVIWLLMWVVPWLWLLSILLLEQRIPESRLIAACLLGLVPSFIIAVYFRMRLCMAPLHPLGAMFFAAIAFNSARLALTRRGHTWKGRHYKGGI